MERTTRVGFDGYDPGSCGEQRAGYGAGAGTDIDNPGAAGDGSLIYQPGSPAGVELVPFPAGRRRGHGVGP
jgi:hypothetical protein